MPQGRSRLDVCTIVRVAGDILQFALSMLQPRGQLAAENLFLRKQLALYLERQVKPRRADDATRLTLVALSRLIDWRPLLTVVKPETLIRWHRKGFHLFWRWKSSSYGRPRLPANLRQLIAEIAERFVRSITEECLDRLIPIGERHFQRAVREFVEHYHRERNHQGLNNALIEGVSAICRVGRIRRHPRLGGLLNYYDRAA